MSLLKGYLFSVSAVALVFLSVPSCAEQLANDPVVLVHSVSDTLNADGTLTVAFKTYEPALGVVEFSEDNRHFTHAYASGKRYDTIHSVKLFDLKPDRLYHYRIRAKNARGQAAFSGAAEFQTESVSYAPPVFQLHMINIPNPGDCFYIVFPNGKKMLYDAGSGIANNTIVSYLQSAGCDTIHYAVATHAHADHYGSYRWGTIPSQFPIVHFFKPDAHNESTYTHVISVIQSSNPGVTVHELERGNSNANTPVLAIDPNIQIVVMSAGAFDLPIDGNNGGGSPTSNINNESLSMKFTYNHSRFFMCGDLEQEAYRAYIQTNAIADPVVDVLKASHHLRIDGMNTGILSATNPIIIIASTESGGGCSNIMQCPALETALASNADVFRIDAADPNLNRNKRERAQAPGNVVILTDGRTIQITKK